MKDLYTILVTIILLLAGYVAMIPPPLELNSLDNIEELVNPKQDQLVYNRLELQTIPEFRRNVTLFIDWKINATVSFEFTWIDFPLPNQTFAYIVDPDYRIHYSWWYEEKIYDHLWFGDAVFAGPWGNGTTTITINSPCEGRFTWYNANLDVKSDLYLNSQTAILITSEPLWLLAHGSNCFWTVSA